VKMEAEGDVVLIGHKQVSFFIRLWEFGDYTA